MSKLIASWEMYGAAIPFASECALLMDRLHRAGLTRTAQKMHDVVREVGYELADAQKELKANDPPTGAVR